MALYLVQHGKSLPKDVDPDQGLAPEGIDTTKRIAGIAKKNGVKVSQIKHSEKTRARQTAEIFASALNPLNGIDAVSGLNPLDDVSAFAPRLDPKAHTMLVGHLPFMERMASYLLTGSVARPVVKFQNSGIVCLAQDPDTNAWVLVWTLLPQIGSPPKLSSAQMAKK